MNRFLRFLLFLIAGIVTPGWAVDGSGVADSAAELYTLSPQDKLAFRIAEDPVKGTELQTVVVTPLGQLQFPVTRGSDIVVRIEAKNKTVKQIAAELKTQLETGYYKTATVSLTLLDRRQALDQVFFTGAVRNSTLPLNPGETRTLFEGLVQVGWTDFANLSKVKINRIDPITKKNQDIIVDVKKIKEKGRRDLDVILRNGDRVNVPEKTLSIFPE